MRKDPPTPREKGEQSCRNFGDTPIATSERHSRYTQRTEQIRERQSRPSGRNRGHRHNRSSSQQFRRNGKFIRRTHTRRQGRQGRCEAIGKATRCSVHNRSSSQQFRRNRKLIRRTHTRQGRQGHCEAIRKAERCCVLCAVCCVLHALCAVCCVLRAACCVYCVLCAVCGVLCAVCGVDCVLCAVCCALCVLCAVCRVLWAVCYVLCAVCGVLWVVCCVSCVIVCCVMLVFAKDGKVTMEFGDTDYGRRKQRSGDGSVTKHTRLSIAPTT